MSEISYEMPKNKLFKDRTNQVFGRITVESFNRIERIYTEEGRFKDSIVFWNCICQCGNKVIVRGTCLINGNTKSCGCYFKEVKTKHGMYNHPLFRRCYQIIQRCHNPKYNEYHLYGGRGIYVDEKWRNNVDIMVKEIEILIGLPPFNKAEIDRIDNNKGYIKGNIRWVDREKNCRNKRTSHNHGTDPRTKKTTSTYNSWKLLIRNFKDEITSEWISDNNPDTDNGFKQFLADMGVKPKYRSPIERYDESKPFCKVNSYWS